MDRTITLPGLRTGEIELSLPVFLEFNDRMNRQLYGMLERWYPESAEAKNMQRELAAMEQKP
jgi:hypothetical protein